MRGREGISPPTFHFSSTHLQYVVCILYIWWNTHLFHGNIWQYLLLFGASSCGGSFTAACGLTGGSYVILYAWPCCLECMLHRSVISGFVYETSLIAETLYSLIWTIWVMRFTICKWAIKVESGVLCLVGCVMFTLHFPFPLSLHMYSLSFTQRMIWSLHHTASSPKTTTQTHPWASPSRTATIPAPSLMPHLHTRPVPSLQPTSK